MAVSVVAAMLGVSVAHADLRDVIRHHRATGEYFGFGGSGFADYQRDRAGLPLVPYEGKLFHNPTTIGQYGLWRYSKWVRNGRSGRLAAARRAADWLVRHQTAAGTWVYEFRWSTSFGTIEPPWPSALAQGTGAALLARIYHATRKTVYLRAARRSLASLRLPLAKGGLRARFGENIWYAEYPIGGGTFELTGMMLTLIGSTISRRSRRRRVDCIGWVAGR